MKEEKMNLRPNSEIVVTLLKTEVCSNHVKLILDKNKVIEIPRNTLYPKELSNYTGTRVGVFRYSDGRYLINKIWKENLEYFIFKGKFGTTIVNKKNIMKEKEGMENLQFERKNDHRLP
jgi:isocitrate dehydrogenase